MTQSLRRRALSGLVLALSLGLGACGSSDTSGGGGGLGSGGVAAGGGGSAGGAIDSGSDAPIDYGPYPAGPYGNAIGDVVANLAWAGHVNLDASVSSDTLPYGDYSSDDVRKSGKSYGLIHLSLQG